MSITIKRYWDSKEIKYQFRADYKGAGGEWYGTGRTPQLALDSLCGPDIAGFIFADTLVDAAKSDASTAIDLISQPYEDTIKDLRKKNAALRREVKGLKR